MPSDFETLTPAQQQVLTLLANGSTASAAAEQAGIHRNTIANWRRSSPAFAREFYSLRYERALHWREGMEDIAAAAIETLRYVMVNHNTPPGVRVRAAIAVLNTVMIPFPEPPDSPPDNVIPMPPPQKEAAESPQQAATPPFASRPRKVAQLCTMPSPASTRNRPVPPSRDQPCPCHSGRKYKYCCLPNALAA